MDRADAVQHHAAKRPGQPLMRGFSLLELVTVTAIIGVLLVVALNRLLPYLDEAERISVLRVEGQLRSVLVMEAAGRIVRGRSSSIAELEGSNPFMFLLEAPKNYVGELQIEQADAAPVRHWYYQPQSHRLIYRPGLPYGLPGRGEHMENPAFAVRVEFDDRDASGSFEAGRDELYGVHLVRVAGQQWLTGVM